MNSKTADKVADLFWEYGGSKNWKALAELFAADCSFTNPLLEKPAIGHAELIELLSSMDDFHNIPEWTVADGNRAVVGWRERKEDGVVERPWYNGVSCFRLNDKGLVQEYEGFFDAKSFMDSYNYTGSQ